MISLTPQHIALAVPADSREEAIRAVGRVLVEAGHIAPGYVESMLGRERQANTYLGHGIAIPHGLVGDRELIRETGVAVVQLSRPIEWNAGQQVRLVVGIAARSDEHLSVLAALTDVLDDPARAEALGVTKNPADIIAALRRESAPAPTTTAAADGEFVDVTIVGSAGLHARPATFFVEVAQQFAAEIRVTHGGRSGNGKAMASLLKLGVPGGQVMRIHAQGPDAPAALQALRAAVESGLGDVEEAYASEALPAWTPVSSGRALSGIPAAPGLAIGPLFQLQTTEIVIRDEAKDAAIEHALLAQALATAHWQLGEIHDAVVARMGKAEAAIFRAHQAFLSDTELRAEVEAHVASGHSAGWGWNEAIQRRIAELEQLGDARLAGRAADLRDVGQRVLRLLAGVEHSEPRFPDEPVILVAEDLTPSDTARLDPRRILGLCTAAGGPTSHTAIIARSLDIPAIVGAGAMVLTQTNSLPCVLDGTSGQLYVEPSAADLESAQRFQAELAQRRDREWQARYEPALLTDGHRVEVVANIGKSSEAARAVEAGAEGIGLMRTEFLFLERDTPPSEEEQFQAYCEMIQALNGLPLIVRTLDIGGDKVVPYLSLPKEDNPFLGVRGVRLCLQRPELFLPQLRAIYRAAAFGPVKIMFPMIATLEDLAQARAVAESVRVELGAAPVEIGIMIEVPSAVALAPELAREVDFFSIGTNDLTQYVLAIDRLHPVLGRHVDGLHPAVLRLIDQTVRAAQAAGKWVGVCGGVAGDPLGAGILTGLGVAELSMSLPSVAAVKASLRRSSLAALQSLAQRALACRTAAEVHALVQA